MDSSDICGRLYSTGQPVRLHWKEGVIAAMEPVSARWAGDSWIAPALVDLQINGFAGVDFQQDDLTAADLCRAAAGLRAAGCAQFLLTLMTDHWERMLERLRHLHALRSRLPELKMAIAGWHLEGPFLSAEPGFCGAHDPARMSDPSEAQIRRLREITGNDPVLLTLAPERAGALPVIRLAVSLGMIVSLGHTNASAEVLRRAVQAGATGFTHFANACPQQLDRHDNILWRVLDTPGLTMSLIPDGYHVSPPLFRLVHRLASRPSIYYTTDAVSAAGAPPGRYSVGYHQVDVGPDQIVRQPGGTNFAGSGLQPVDGIFRAAEMLGAPWQEVWGHLSAAPARFMGWARELSPGQAANLCLLDMAGSRPGRVRTLVQGREL